MKRGAGTGEALDIDRTAVAAHNPVHDGEAEAGALARVLRGEERVEDAAARGFVHPVAGVGDRDPHVAAAGWGADDEREVGTDVDGFNADGERAAVEPHGVGGVGPEVEQYLVNLRGVAEDVRAVGCEVVFDRDVGGEGRAQEAAGFLDDEADVDRRVAAAGGLATEREDLFDQFAGAQAGVAGLGQAGARRMVFGHGIGGEFVVTDDAGEEVVEIVRDAAGECPEGLHLLGLKQLAFEFAASFVAFVAGGDVLNRAVDRHGPVVPELDMADDAHPEFSLAGGEQRYFEFVGGRGRRGLVTSRPQQIEPAVGEELDDVVGRGLEVFVDLMEPAGALGPDDLARFEIELPAADEGDEADLRIEFFAAAETFFQFLAGRDVGVRADHAERAAVGRTTDDFAAVEDPLPLAGFGEHAVLVLIKSGAAVGVVFFRGFAGAEIFRVDQTAPAFEVAGDFVGGVAEHRGPAFVVVEGAGFHVPVPDAVVGAFEGELPALFGQIEGLLQLLLAGDVAVETD